MRNSVQTIVVLAALAGLPIVSAAATVSAVLPPISPLYINNSPVTTSDIPPQIDALGFLNRSVFDVFTTLPFQAQNVLAWTNNGVMSGSPGYRFENDTDGRRIVGKGRRARIVRNSQLVQLPSSEFINDGRISVTTLLSVSATNIHNPGRLDGGETANISINAKHGTADLTRGGIRTGAATGVATPCDTFSVSSNFFTDPNIVDIYWGAGRNNRLGTNGTVLNLPSLTGIATTNPVFSDGSFTVPFPSTPSHEILMPSGGRTITNTTSLSVFGGCASGYDAFVHTNFNTATSMVYNIVFIPTNSILAFSNLDVAVRFAPNSGPAGQAYAPIVEFRSVDYDVVDQRFATNYVTFVDASAALTNIILARPAGGASSTARSTRRPWSYTWIKGRYCGFDSTGIFGFGLQDTNSSYNQGVFYDQNFQTNTVNTLYAADSVNVGLSASQPATTVVTPATLGVSPIFTDPTNFTGSISIFSSNLNLAGTRLRAEQFIGIHTDNLISNSLAQVDAPYLDFNLTTTNAELVLSNIAPAVVNRLFGSISAWSSVWDVNVTNSVSGQLHNIRFHVLYVQNCLQSQQPVIINRLAARAPNLVLHDRFLVNSGVSLDAAALTVETNGSLILPYGSNLAFTNTKHLLNFTNNGAISAPASAYFGDFQAGHVVTNPVVKVKRKKGRRPPPEPTNNLPPLDNFVDHGSISGSSVFIRATNVTASGREFFPATITANGGVVQTTGESIVLSNAVIRASSDLELHGNSIALGNTKLNAGSYDALLNTYIRGSILIDSTNSLGDFGGTTTNDWYVTSGMRISRLPATVGDFLGTRLHSYAGSLIASSIIWPGQNRGATAAGFQNNLALGRLVLEGVGGNLFRFRSATTNNALYVDYLELRGNAVDYNFALGVDPDFTIYFADSNIDPAKLDNVSGGRLRWVSSFTGPQSSTNLVYRNGATYTFNAGVVRSRELDSDGDGWVNDEDCTPLIPPGEEANTALWYGRLCPGDGAPPPPPVATRGDMGLVIRHNRAGEVLLTWLSPAGSTNRLEYNDSLGRGAWLSLTNFINGPVNARVTVKDAAGAPLRVYRVRVDAANLR
jgi:hypothetical protein